MKNRYRGQIIYFLALICLASLRINRASSIGQPEAERLFRSRIPNDIAKFFNRLQTSPLTLEGFNEYAPQREKETVLIRKSSDFYLLKSEYHGENANAGSDICNGINSKYGFELVKNKSGIDWTASRVIFLTPEIHEFNERRQGFRLAGSHGGFRSIVDDSISELTKVYLSNARISMEKLFELPGFELKTVATDRTADNILHASFSYDVIDSKTMKSSRSNCSLDFDINMHCLPIKLYQSYKNGSEEVTYDWQRDWLRMDDDNYSFRLIIKTKRVSDLKPNRLSEFGSKMKVILHDIPESDFTLSAFGLLEPPGVEWKRPIPWYLVLAVVGIISMGIFFFLRTRAKRLNS